MQHDLDQEDLEEIAILKLGSRPVYYMHCRSCKGRYYKPIETFKISDPKTRGRKKNFMTESELKDRRIRAAVIRWLLGYLSIDNYPRPILDEEYKCKYCIADLRHSLTIYTLEA